MQRLYDQQQLRFPAPVESLARVAGFGHWLAELRRQGWVVYSKAPFAGPQKVLDYLGRYTHRVAISNHRLLSADEGVIRFHYRDRVQGNQVKVATLPADEFLRRFLWHVLPGGFQRIRHHGLLASRHKESWLRRCRELLNAEAPPPPEKKNTVEWLLLLLGLNVSCCPRCGQTLQRAEWPQQDEAATVPAVPEPATRDTS